MKNEKSYYDNCSAYSFEGMFCPAPTDYDAVLSQMYGDYMTPPTKDLQNKHNTEVIFVDETQENHP